MSKEVSISINVALVDDVGPNEVLVDVDLVGTPV